MLWFTKWWVASKLANKTSLRWNPDHRTHSNPVAKLTFYMPQAKKYKIIGHTTGAEGKCVLVCANVSQSNHTKACAHTPTKWTTTALRSETQHDTAIDVSCVFAFHQEANQDLFVSISACVSVSWWMLNKEKVQNVEGHSWSWEGFCVWGDGEPPLILRFDWAPFVLQTLTKNQLGLRNRTKTRRQSPALRLLSWLWSSQAMLHFPIFSNLKDHSH